jgi:hypothetical protein
VALEDMETMLENIPAVVSEEENKDLLKPIEEAEIQNTIWSLKPDKAPEPDGVSISF